MKSLQTRYKGYHFRSRLEARWAVFFDALGVEWEYEKEGFELDPYEFEIEEFIQNHWEPGVDRDLLRAVAEKYEEAAKKPLRYLPDFWLPTIKCYAEVKGELHPVTDTDKMCRLVNQSGYPLLYLQDLGKQLNTITAFFPRDTRRNLVNFKDFSYNDATRFSAAIDAARSARFEYGQSGAR